MGYLLYDVGLKTTAWIIAMCFIGVIGTLFIIKAIKTSKEIPSQREMFRSIGLFFYLYIVSRFFFILSDYERDPYGETDLYFQFVALSYISSIIGFLLLIYIGEKYIFKPGKFFMTYIILVFLVINIIILVFFPSLFAIGRYINYGLFYMEGAIMFLIYLYLITKTSGQLRKNAIRSLVGLSIMAMAMILETDFLLSEGITQPYYSPIFFSIGAIIFAYGQLKGIS